jgi:hypothetical protein
VGTVDIASLQQSASLFKTLLLLIGLVLVYSAFLTRTYYWDGVLFSLYIEKVHRAELPFSILFHPNHLLYSVLGYFLYSLLGSVGLHPRAITVLQLVNVFASAGSTALIFVLTKRLCRSTGIAAFCSLLFAFGATWWKFSTDADSYILSVLLLLLASGFVLNKTPSLVLAGVCHSLAMLFHELAVFIYVPVLTIVFLEHRPGSVRVRRAFIYLLGTAGSVVFAYQLAYSFAGRNSGRTFLGWITSSSAESQITHSWRQILVAYPVSYLKLLAGGKLSLIRDYFSLPVIAALAFSVVALIAGVWLMRYPRQEPGILIDGRIKVMLWAWILPYLVFLAWWEPGSAFYKLFVWPPIVLLLGCSIAERPSWTSRARALVAFSAALAAWNFGAFVFPHSRSSADPVLALAERIDRELPKNAVVYYKVLSPDDWYLQYFAPGRRWLQLPGDLISLRKTDAELVCFETTALEVMNVQFNLSHKWQLINSKHHIQLACH